MSEPRTDQSGRWLALLLSLALVRGLLYSAIIPPWMAPDEPRHFEYVRLIYENRRLVNGSDLSLPVQQAIIESMDRFDFWRLGRFINPRFQPGSMPHSFEDIWYPGQYDPNEPNMAHQLHQPALYYALNAAILHLLPTDDVTTQLYLLRVMSVLTAVGMVGLAYLVSWLLFPGDVALQLVVPAFVLLLPTYGFMSASVNNDRLAEFAAALVISLLTLILVRGVRLSAIVALVGSLALALLAKRSALFTWGLAVVAVGPFLWVHPPSRSQRGRVMLGVAGLVLAIGLGLALWGRQVGTRAETVLRAATRGGSLNVGMAISELQAHPARYIWRPFRSFWGRFGWENVGFPDVWFVVPALLVILAGLGILVLCRRALAGQASLSRRQWAALLLFAMAVAGLSFLNIAAAIAGNLGTKWVVFVPHGRYWFPVLIPIATFLAVGLEAWVPPPHRGTWAKLTVLGLALYDLAALLFIIVPHFYG